MLLRRISRMQKLTRTFAISISIGTNQSSTSSARTFKMNENGKPVYLDNNATTTWDPRVIDAMMPLMTSQYGNPHSRSHSFGWEAENLVEEAREKVANLIGAEKREIIFTSGATESNNAILKGVANFYKSKKNHIITTQIEHKCVLDSWRYLERNGFEVTYLPVEKNGVVSLDRLREAIRPSTVLASVMYWNNEIGVIQPIKEIGEICREQKVFFHTDAAQAVGKIPINVDELKIDLMSISAHKIYGPKGCGAMFIRRKPRVRLEPLINGGGQERGLRSGTLAPHLVVGLGEAWALASKEMENDKRWITYLTKRFKEKIENNLTHIQLNGDPEQRYYGNLNFSFAGVEGESLLMGMKEGLLYQYL